MLLCASKKDAGEQMGVARAPTGRANSSAFILGHSSGKRVTFRVVPCDSGVRVNDRPILDAFLGCVIKRPTPVGTAGLARATRRVRRIPTRRHGRARGRMGAARARQLRLLLAPDERLLIRVPAWHRAERRAVRRRLAVLAVSQAHNPDQLLLARGRLSRGFSPGEGIQADADIQCTCVEAQI